MACPDDNLLVAMVQRTLEPHQFADLENHIDSCDSCRKIVAAAVADTGALAVGTPASEVDEIEALGKLVDTSINERYVIDSVLGKGGMGTVYLARDVTLDREVALKLHRAGTGSERLHREAMAMAKLSHPNVVGVFEVATVEDRLYVAMEYVKGETLRGWRSALRSWRAIVAMLLETGNGLAAAHAAGLVHRDFKPENVLVGDDGRPRVGDFGLARVGASPSGDKPLSKNTPLDARMTVTGTLLGTPAYMAPEQIAGDVVDARCDQFAFCVVAWELLYGKRPFAGATLAALEESINTGKPWLPTRSDVPPRLRAVLERGLAAQPSSRYADMPALLSAMRAAVKPRTTRWVALGLALTALVGGGTAFAIGAMRDRDKAAVCAAAEDEMHAAVDPAKRLAVRAAFIGTGARDANGVFNRTEKVLLRYADALATQAGKACRGTDEPRVITLARTSCLADRRRHLESYMTIMGKPDKPMVSRATSSAWSMFDPTPCDDTQTLLARAKTSNTTTPEAAATIRQIESLNELGKTEEALALAKPLLDDARKRGDKSAELSALIELGQLYADVEDVANTGSHFEQAISLAETMGRDLDAAIAYSALANHHGVVTNDYAAAHRSIGLARAKLQRLGGANPALRGELLMIEAQIFADENRLGEAEKSMREAATTIETAYGPEHPKLGAAYGTLAQILRYLNKNDEALVAAQRTLEVLQASYGDEHPYVAGAEMTLGQSLTDFNRFDEARTRYERADKVFAKFFGEVHPYRAAIAANLASLELSQKNYAVAEAHSRRALAMVETMKGPIHMDSCAARGDVARAMGMAGRYAEALAEQKKVVYECYEKLGPDGEVRIVGGLLDLAHYQLDTKSPADAVKSTERALRILAKRPPDASPAEVGEAKYLLARALWEVSKKEHARARKLAEEAVGAPMNEDLTKGLTTWLAEHTL